MTVVRPGVDILDWSSPVAVDSSPSPNSSKAYARLVKNSTSKRHVMYLLVCETASGEYPVRFRNLVLPPTAWLVLEIAFEPMNDVSSTVCGGFRQVGCL